MWQTDVEFDNIIAANARNLYRHGFPSGDEGEGVPGAIIIEHATWRGIHEHVEHARIKHPWRPGVSGWYKLRVLLSEVGELAWAVMVERKPKRVRDEALDCIAVLVRIVEGDGGVRKWLL